ncbi:amidohydrolase [Amnibacterium setariae]|uniref:Amidohydrolase n=1 Tax=Amnibacterium setariae TaxID=2306585 RepID=A0A3A1TW09_9MICO|nr:amidohydrolase [Amnibacterium setariae]RIX28443.1 amidohydrolase [Amnibacterium setariae]
MTRPLVVAGARLFTGRALHPSASAVAVRDGRIVAIGGLAEAREAAGPGAEVLDVPGGLVGPGFVDAHVHPAQGGGERLRCDLTDAVGAEDTLARIRAYADAHPDDEWIVGGGWHMADFERGLPRADALERVVPGRKVYLVNADHHGAWVSPAALAAAGIDGDRADPADGHIDRDPDGAPSGTLQEGAMELLADLLPVPTDAEHVAALDEAQRYLTGFGVTGWQDAIIGAYSGVRDPTDAYLAAIDAGRLSVLVSGALWLERGIGVADVDRVVAGLVAARDRIGDRRGSAGGRFRATSVKIMLDGVPESRTAAMKAPYLDADGRPTAETGSTHFAPEVLDAVAPALAAAGFQLHIHAIGDRAVADALHAIELANRVADGGRLRHHLAHLQQVDLADVPGMARSGATANLQAFWACRSDQMVDLNLPLVGRERFEQQYAFASMAAAGVPLAMGSDWPVSTPDPWQAIAVAVTRIEAGSLREPLGPHEALTLEQALTAYTAGSARVAHHDEAGLLEVGRRADVAVADRDPFLQPAEALHAVRTAATVSAGRVVHAR